MGTEGGLLQGSSIRSAFLGVSAAICVILIYLLYNANSKMPSIEINSSSIKPTFPPVVVNVNLNDTGTNTIKKAPSWDYDWDKRAAEMPADIQNIQYRRLILVRHGHYDVETGHLTDKGKEQVNITAKRIKEYGTQLNSIYYSTHYRTTETAELIHKYFPDVPMYGDDIIKEGGPTQPTPTLKWWNLPDVTYHQDGPRLEAAFRKYFYRPGKDHTQPTVEMLVGHGNIFRFFVLRALQLEKSAWMRVFIPHASVTVLDLNADSSVSMNRFGESGHLPQELVSYS